MMTRALLSIFAVLVVGCAAAGATEASLVLSRQSTSQEPSTNKTAKPAVTPTGSNGKAAPSGQSVPNNVNPHPLPPSPAPQPAAPASPTATVNGYVHLRTMPSTTAPIIEDLYQGYVVSYSVVDSGAWQAVTYNGKQGYIYKAYLNY